jgi:hypothetical protein
MFEEQKSAQLEKLTSFWDNGCAQLPLTYVKDPWGCIPGAGWTDAGFIAIVEQGDPCRSPRKAGRGIVEKMRSPGWEDRAHTTKQSSVHSLGSREL